MKPTTDRHWNGADLASRTFDILTSGAGASSPTKSKTPRITARIPHTSQTGWDRRLRALYRSSTSLAIPHTSTRYSHHIAPSRHVPSFTCFCGQLASCGECRKLLKKPPPRSSHTIHVIVLTFFLCAQTSCDPPHAPSARAYLSRRVRAVGTTALTSRPFNFTKKCMTVTLTLHVLSCTFLTFLSCPFVTFDILGLP